MRDIESSRLVIKEQLRDSTLWDAITPRKDDIVIASCYKSGTTLTQQIVNLLINKDDKFICVQEASPWVDFALFPSSPDKLEALPSPRFLKSHLPFEALPHYEGWKYIYLVRDGRDVCTSLFNHCKSHLVKTDRQGISIDNGPDDFSTFFDLWLETGKPRWDFWENVNSWWNVRH
jgi:aryl sulfotransferase